MYCEVVYCDVVYCDVVYCEVVYCDVVCCEVVYLYWAVQTHLLHDVGQLAERFLGQTLEGRNAAERQSFTLCLSLSNVLCTFILSPTFVIDHCLCFVL